MTSLDALQNARDAGRDVGVSARGWVDVSVTLQSGMPHCPHGIGYMSRRVSDVAKLDATSVSVVWMGSHTGTHVDAPAHLLLKGSTIESMPLDATIGAAVVADLGRNGGTTARLRVDDLERIEVEAGGRLLLKTGGRALEVTDGAAGWLTDRALRAVGAECHLVNDAVRCRAKRILLEAGIWLIEGLDLGHVEPGRYELLCLPLKMAGSDAAPARALLRRL